MKNYIFQKFNKKNILFILMLVAIIFLSLLPRYSYANNPSNLFIDESRLFGFIDGNACGNTTCQSDEVCQKEYRGVLPVESDTTLLGAPKSTTFTCVKARPIEAPASPFRGTQGCAEGPGGGILGSVLGDTVSGLVGNGLTGLVDGISLIGTGGGLFGLPQAFTFVNPGGVITDTLLNGLNPNANFNDLIRLRENGEDDCENYNNINRVIDTRRLTAPLPVDIFNPLPLPVNVTSPTPLPVVVVDDLALYQQKELIDAPLAAQQKAQTIATITDTLRTEISAQNLIPQNYFATKSLGIEFGALSPETGVVSKEVLDVYGGYQNFSLAKNNELAQYFRDLQDPTKSQLPRETFTEKCGNVLAEQAGEISFECALLVLQTNNNANDIAATTAQIAANKAKLSSELLESELRDGGGFFATTENNNKNPLTKSILTPASNTQALTDKVLASTIDQAILGSGTRCFEAIPNNILNASLKPVLTQGLFNVSNPLASINSGSANSNNNTATNIAGAGTVSTTANGTTVTGTSTRFRDIFKVGDAITINGETSKLITAINSNTELTVSSPFSNTARNNVSYNYFRELSNLASSGNIPDPNQFVTSLQNSLLNNITSSLSCVFQQQITTLLNGALGNINIPGIGNIPGSATRTVNRAVDGAIREGVNSLLRQ